MPRPQQAISRERERVARRVKALSDFRSLTAYDMARELRVRLQSLRAHQWRRVQATWGYKNEGLVGARAVQQWSQIDKALQHAEKAAGLLSTGISWRDFRTESAEAAYEAEMSDAAS